MARPVGLSGLIGTMSLLTVFPLRKLFILTVSKVVCSQEDIHVKIHPGSTSNLLFSGLYIQPPLSVGCIPSYTASGFPGGQFILQGPLALEENSNQPALDFSCQSSSHKTAASLSMKPFQFVKCRLLAPLLSVICCCAYRISRTQCESSMRGTTLCVIQSSLHQLSHNEIETNGKPFGCN